MARINIEDELFRDKRWFDLVIEMKNAATALGELALVWMSAQAFWKHSDNGIPRSHWVNQKLNDAVIRVGLAENRGDFIFVIGSEKHFAWIRQKVEAGSDGGTKKAQNQREKQLAEPSADQRSLPSPSFSLSPSLSSSDSSSISKSSRARSRSGTTKPKVETSETWESYSKAFTNRFGDAPVRNKTVNSQMKSFVERIGRGDAPYVAQYYVEHNNGYYIQRGHSVGAMLADAEKLRTEWATGKQITNVQARQMDSKQTRVNVFREILEEEEQRRVAT